MALKPSTPGMLRSIRTTSGSSSRASAIAWRPSNARPTTSIRSSLAEDQLERLREETLVVGDQDAGHRE